MYYRCDKYKNEVVLNQLEDEVHKLLWEKEIKEMKLKDEQKEKEESLVRQDLDGYGYVSRPGFEFKETRQREGLGEYIITRN